MVSSRSMAKPHATAPSHTAKVLPEPVVACSRPERPSAIAAHTSRWKANEDQPREANQRSAASFMRRTRTTGH